MRVAVCFSGVSRNVDSGLKTLDLIYPNDNVKIFAHTWLNLNNQKTYHNNVLDVGSINDFYLLKKFNFETILIENYQIKKKQFQKIYNLLDFENRPGGPPRSDLGILSMFYSIYKSNLLKCKYEEENNIKFDKVIRIRFDTNFHNQILNLENINGDLCIPLGNDSEGINDQFAVGSSEMMDIYSNVFNSLSLLDTTPYNPEVILKEHLNINNVSVHRFQFDISLKRSENLHSRRFDLEHGGEKYFTNKLVIFDLDGVLIDSKEAHYESLNKAISNVDKKYTISKDEHLSFYDGLSTFKKLKMLSEKKGLPIDTHQQIWEDKQKVTLDIFSDLNNDNELINYFKQLKNTGYKIAVASNSIESTVKLILTKLGLIELVDCFVSNEDVTHIKPFPEMYWKCMSNCNALPKNTVIFEDSHIGRQSAIDSGATLIPIENRKYLNQEKIDKVIKILSLNKLKNVPWRSDKMNVLIPMAGAGSRFANAGYTFPKPLIEVNGKPMIQVVVENLNIEANYIFIVQKEHYEKYNLKYLLNLISPNCNVVQVDGITEGAACTTLLAKEFIDNESPLLIANSDQFVEWDSNECLYAFSSDQIDGGIVTFKATHPKWSYVKLNEDEFVSEVAEKKPISDNATVGIYFWNKGSNYVKYAEQMIQKNVRTNNEFYVCPVFNEAISDGKKIKVKQIEKMWGIGTPEDLEYYLNNYKM